MLRLLRLHRRGSLGLLGFQSRQRHRCGDGQGFLLDGTRNRCRRRRRRSLTFVRRCGAAFGRCNRRCGRFWRRALLCAAGTVIGGLLLTVLVIEIEHDRFVADVLHGRIGLVLVAATATTAPTSTTTRACTVAIRGRRGGARFDRLLRRLGARHDRRRGRRCSIRFRFFNHGRFRCRGRRARRILLLLLLRGLRLFLLRLLLGTRFAAGFLALTLALLAPLLAVAARTIFRTPASVGLLALLRMALFAGTR